MTNAPTNWYSLNVVTYREWNVCLFCVCVCVWAVGNFSLCASVDILRFYFNYVNDLISSCEWFDRERKFIVVVILMRNGGGGGGNGNGARQQHHQQKQIYRVTMATSTVYKSKKCTLSIHEQEQCDAIVLHRLWISIRFVVCSQCYFWNIHKYGFIIQ